MPERTEDNHGTHQPYQASGARIETGLPTRKSKRSIKWQIYCERLTDFKIRTQNMIEATEQTHKNSSITAKIRKRAFTIMINIDILK
jgi:hypothetical protein